jgi:uncharacterized protein
VFLAGDRVYKLKKPIVLPFLDYGTPARRLMMSRAEVRLNRRLAPDLYLGVRAIVEGTEGFELRHERHPEAIDYVVEMRRYDERRTVAAILAHGELRRRDIEAVAQTLHAFHGRCPARRGRLRGSTAVRREVERNIAELLPLEKPGHQRDRIRSLGRALSAYISRHAEELDLRRAAGRVRECHGDLRAEHVLLDDRSVRVVDCVEFDRTLRTLDVADDLAFLMMDLTALGGERYADNLIDAYRSAGGDCGDDTLLAFFAIHRALVRLKVGGRASLFLELAERYRWRMLGPLTVVVCGLPASGKSHLANALADRAGAIHLSSDHVRKRLAHLEPADRGRPELYREEFNQATYAELGRLAASEAAAGRSAIVDATFRRRADRDAFDQAFAGASPRLFVECRVPRAILLKRARAREREIGRVSDATAEVVRGARWDALRSPRPIVVRTERPVDVLVAEVTEAVTRWFSTGVPAV